MAATLEPAVNGSADSGATTNDAPPTIRLNIHEKARTVTSVCTSGTLCTISSEPTIDGSPFGSFVDYVLDDTGNPILLMNEMSMHTINIQNNPQVTLFTQLGNEGQDVSRCSVAGKLVKLRTDDEQMDTIRMRYSIAHAYADQVMDSPKFAFYRLEPSKIYFVGGFGVSSQWIDPQEYYAAHPDILAKSSSDILSNLNKSHQDDLKNTARYLLQIDNVESVRVTSVDRLGMDVRVTFEAGSRRSKLQTDEFRVGFRIPVLSVEDAKSEVYKGKTGQKNRTIGQNV